MQDCSPCQYLRSTLGLKVVMAATGVVLFGFVAGHVAGNLLIFLGPEKLNEYSKFLHESQGLLWGTRLVLLVAVAAHVASAIRLTQRKAAARPVPYLGKKPHGSSYASRTMMWSGPIVALFVIYHLLHFTTGHLHPTFDPKNVYANVVSAFQRPSVCATYILAMLALGIHLSHGLWSVTQTVGINRPNLEPALRKAAVAVAALLIAGFIAVPLGVWTGLVGGKVAMDFNANCPTGPIETSWERHRFDMKLVSPANRRKHTVIVVGTGLAGGAAAATLGELGYNVHAFCYQDSPRRAHSIAAQGGINAAKNYSNDGDSVYRLFYDTIKGGDFRARERNVYRLAQISVNIIDQCAAQGVPFAREYSGYLTNRSFGGTQVARTFYARGQTGQQLLLGAYQALSRQIHAGRVKMHSRTEMLDLIVVDGRARGIVTRDLVSGKVETHAADAVLLATGGYGNVFYLSTNAKGCNTTAIWRAHKKGALLANPCFTQIHPTCIPVTGDYQSKLTLMSESLRNDGRIWVPKEKGDQRAPNEIPDDQRDYYLERRYPAFGNLVPRDVASRAAKASCDEGRGVGETGLGVYLDFRDAIQRMGAPAVAEKYGNLLDMYQRITGENPYRVPMRIFPAVHYTMGGLWVDYNLMSTIPGCFVAGEANFSDHGANRLGASALMQGLADGYFIAPSTMANYLATTKLDKVSDDHAAFKAAAGEVESRVKKLLSIRGKRTVDSFHRELGKIVWNKCGMARNAAGLKEALQRIPELREEFWRSVAVVGENQEFNTSLEKAGRVADFLEFGELMVRDALEREESCGGHFREEHQTPEGEARRDDEKFCHGAAWEWKGEGRAPVRNVEPLTFDYVHPAQRSYK